MSSNQTKRLKDWIPKHSGTEAGVNLLARKIRGELLELSRRLEEVEETDEEPKQSEEIYGYVLQVRKENGWRDRADPHRSTIVENRREVQRWVQASPDHRAVPLVMREPIRQEDCDGFSQ